MDGSSWKVNCSEYGNWRAVLKTIMNFRVSQQEGTYLIVWGNVSFSGRILFLWDY